MARLKLAMGDVASDAPPGAVLGYRISTSRWRHHTSDNFGGLMIIDSYNLVVAGDRFSLTLDDAEEWLDQKATA